MAPSVLARSSRSRYSSTVRYSRRCDACGHEWEVPRSVIKRWCLAREYRQFLQKNQPATQLSYEPPGSRGTDSPGQQPVADRQIRNVCRVWSTGIHGAQNIAFRCSDSPRARFKPSGKRARQSRPASARACAVDLSSPLR